MTIKIKAPRAWANDELTASGKKSWGGTVPVRIVREADWRKLMKLVRECEPLYDSTGRTNRELFILAALDALKGAK